MTDIQLLLQDLKQQAGGAVIVTGPSQLHGKVRVQGAKNTALKIIPGLACFPAVYKLRNIPLILDVLELFGIIELLGGEVHLEDPATGSFRVDTTNLENREIPYELTRSTTTAFYFAGALLGRFGSVSIGKPGGDEIGARPVDLHVQGFRDLGASVDESEYEIQATLKSPPKMAKVEFRMPSAGAAINIILAVAAAHGSAEINKAPLDSDMRSFCNFMRICGLDIDQRDGGITIGESSNTQPGTLFEFTCSPDRNDTFTWLAAAATSPLGVEVEGVDFEDMRDGLEVIDQLGVGLQYVHPDVVSVRCPSDGLRLPEKFIIEAGTSPGFHSDWAPFLQLIFLVASGTGQTVDTLHSNRIRQAAIYREMGAKIEARGGQPPAEVSVHFRTPLEDARYIVSVNGPAQLSAVKMDVGNDVRACAAAVLAGSLANGSSEFGDVYALWRGYADFLGRLQGLGVNVSTRPVD